MDPRAAAELDRLRAQVAELQAAMDSASADSSPTPQAARLRKIVQSDMMGVLFWQGDGQVVDANDYFLRLTGYQRAEISAGRLNLQDLTPREFAEQDGKCLEQMRTTGACEHHEKEIIHRDGSLLPVMMGGALLEPHDGQVEHDRGVAFVLDVTERKRAERALSDSEAMFRTLAENVPGVVYLCNNDERYTMLFLNEAVMELTGVARKEFLEDRISFVELYHPDDAPHIAPAVEEALSRRQAFRLNYRLRHADGRWRWVEEHGQGVFDSEGTLQFLEGTVLDITARKTAEDELRLTHQQLRDVNESLEQRVAKRTAELEKLNQQLRQEQSLLRQNLDEQERDRRLVAYDIHDGLAQYLTAALMHLDSVNRDLLVGSSNEGRYDLGLALVEKGLAEARRLITGLRPPILDESGVIAAIEYLISEQPLADDIKFIHDVQFDRLIPLLESTVFRIVQEALSNITQHSSAERARVKLVQKNQRMKLTIRDWGEGFDSKAAGKKSHGLRGIRERARLLGGNARIRSRQGDGTRITVNLPVVPDTQPSDNSKSN